MIRPADQAGPDVLEMNRTVTYWNISSAAIGQVDDLGRHRIGEPESMRCGEAIGHNVNDHHYRKRPAINSWTSAELILGLKSKSN